MPVKTDNANPAAKLALRRHFLRPLVGAGVPLHVLDCCQATGFLWRTLGSEFPLTSYWGVDLVPKKGRFKIDSARILDQPGWNQNVIDVDTYGSPWTHWLALLRHAPAGPLTVFLTIGSVRAGGGGQLPLAIRNLLGLHFRKAKLSVSFTPRLLEIGTQAMLAAALDHGFTVDECREAPRSFSARYLGIRLARS